jgi:hypothetical protein
LELLATSCMFASSSLRAASIFPSVQLPSLASHALLLCVLSSWSGCS